MVIVRTISGEEEQFPLSKCVFASSSELEDKLHMFKLGIKYNIPREYLVTCGTIEQMWGLVSQAPLVVTDRYHPGVAAHIVGSKVIITEYKNENRKMAGLNQMIKDHTPSEIRKLNEAAFLQLRNTMIKHSA